MSKKILLAEDSKTMRKVFELAFAQSDVALTVVDNGEEAVRLARETAPDLVVADVTLPGRDGFQVAEDLGASEVSRSCPVLILSGTISPFDEEKFRKSGARGVLFKPFEAQELSDKVQELLRGGEETALREKGEAAPPAAEPWDFSDVLEEVEHGRGKAAPPVSPRGEDLLPGASPVSLKAEGGLSLGEFDVSLEEIEASSSETPKEASVEAPADSGPPVSHLEGDPFTDAPGAVTDLEPALQAAEELEEIEDLDEVDLLQRESGKPSPPESRPGAESAQREQFSARAQEIFEKVAAEAVEKVLWEFMERFSAEFSERIRESVEAVAWEVIPPTAEALIREEIARIRQQTEKKSP
jgi:CheY-like chemotaxis protein